MFQLKTWVDKDGELTPKGRKVSQVLVCAYLLCLVLLCWTPQYGLVEGVETPGIQHFGRVVVLLTPFNSLTNFYQLDSLKEIVFVLGTKCDQHFLAESADFRAFSLVSKIQVLEKGPFSHVYHVFDD